MTIWEETVKTAVVGSERQDLTLSLPAGSELERLCSQLETTPIEAYLLKVSGILTTYRQASWRPTSDPLPQLDPCDLDDLPLCSERSRQLLEMILDKTHRQVLPEWLTLATQAGQRIPGDLLPSVLDQGRQQKDLRDRIQPVLGKRGRWLASQNPAWGYACGSEPLESGDWKTGDTHQRLALLKQIGPQDPVQIRQWIRSTWSEDGADFRASCLQILGETLSPEDLPWLTEVFDTDRSKQVRAEAAELLSRLPDSELCQRMRDRVEPLLTLTHSADQTPHVKVSLPTEFTPDLLQDGISKTSESHLGEKAGWLAEMLARIPASEWCQRWDLAPESLLQAIEAQWLDLFLEGWGKAVYRFQEHDWVEPLLNVLCGSENQNQDRQRTNLYQANGFQWISHLANLLPPDQLQQFCLQILSSDPGSLLESGVTHRLLRSCQTAWSAALTQQFIACCQQVFRSGQFKMDYLFRDHLLHYGLYMDPSQGQQVARELSPASAQGYYLTRAVEELIALLEFRHQIHQSFS